MNQNIIEKEIRRIMKNLLCGKKGSFPSSYLKAIQDSGIPLIDISKELKLPYNRFLKLVHSKGKMDNTEFKIIKEYVNRLEKI